MTTTKTLQSRHDEAVKAVETKLHTLFSCPAELTCKVYTYTDTLRTSDLGKMLKNRPWVGVRVAEVSFHNSRGGSSFMQVDVPYGLLLCAAVERVLLATIEDWEPMEIEEETWRLEEVVKFCKGEKS